MITPEQISTYYRDDDKDPVLLAGMIVSCQNATGMNQHQLARECGITPGTLHHYASLLKLPASLQNAVSEGRLPFKVARALADLDSPDLMLKHAQPFMDGTLSSVWVERYVILAKEHPAWGVAMLVNAARSHAIPLAPASDVETTEGLKRMAYTAHATPAEIRVEALALVGRLRMLNGASEVERMPMVSALRTLKRELETVL